jgi:hypothetical protein
MRRLPVPPDRLDVLAGRSGMGEAKFDWLLEGKETTARSVRLGLLAPGDLIGSTRHQRTHLSLTARSIVVQDRADATILGEQRIAAIAEQVQVEGLVGLLLAVAFDFNRDGLRRLAGGEGQRVVLGDVVAGARFGVPFTVRNEIVTA